MSILIGVLAGMGPRSTAPFIDMLVDACQSLYGAKNDMDFPKMHIISLPTPFYPGHDIDDGKMAAALQSGINDLVKAGVNLIVVPCNLAHRYYSQMKEASAKIPVLHIADCALKTIPTELKKVAIVGTQPTLDAGFYQERIVSTGKEVVSSPNLCNYTTELIKLVKERGFEDHEVIKIWNSILSEADLLMAEVILIACTDNDLVTFNLIPRVFL